MERNPTMPAAKARARRRVRRLLAIAGGGAAVAVGTVFLGVGSATDGESVVVAGAPAPNSLEPGSLVAPLGVTATAARFGEVADVAVDQVGRTWIADRVHGPLLIGPDGRLTGPEAAGAEAIEQLLIDRACTPATTTTAASTDTGDGAETADDDTGGDDDGEFGATTTTTSTTVVDEGSDCVVDPALAARPSPFPTAPDPELPVSPVAFAVGLDDGLYVAGHGAVWRIDLVTGLTHRVVGTGMIDPMLGDGGPALAASVDPGGLAILDDGDLLVSEPARHRVRRVDADTGIITTWAGRGAPGDDGDGGPAGDALFHHPTGLAVGPDGSVAIADQTNRRVRVVDAEGIITTAAGDGTTIATTDLDDGRPALEVAIGLPADVITMADGSIVWSDPVGGLVRRRAPDGTISTLGVLLTGAEGGSLGTTLLRPTGLHSDGQIVHIADSDRGQVIRFTPAGTN